MNANSYGPKLIASTFAVAMINQGLFRAVVIGG